MFSHMVAKTTTSTVFMFPGGGAQYHRMAADLYETEPVLREHIDRGAELLQSQVGYDFRELIFASEENAEEAARELERAFGSAARDFHSGIRARQVVDLLGLETGGPDWTQFG